MTRCEPYKPYLAALADDQVDAVPGQTRQEFLAHVQTCPACQKEIAQQRRMVQLLAGQLPPAVPADRWRQVWDAIDEQTTSQARSARRFAPLGWGRWAAVASSIAVAAMLLLAVLLWSRMQPGGGPESPQAVPRFAFATGQDSDIEVLESDPRDATPVVITSGQEDVVIVWVVQDPDEQKDT